MIYACLFNKIVLILLFINLIVGIVNCQSVIISDLQKYAKIMNCKFVGL